MIDNEKRRTIEGGIFLLLFCLTIPAANWMIGNVGTVCPAKSPCLVPVAPGIMAPSGVLMIGAALVLRDLVQRRLGVESGLGAIVAGAALSAAAPPSLVVASAVASPVGICRFAVTHARPPPAMAAVVALHSSGRDRLRHSSGWYWLAGVFDRADYRSFDGIMAVPFVAWFAGATSGLA
jgi:hypothetical protein